MIKLMDSSIRDGGNVNDWKFGKRVIDGIIKNLVESKIDIIELGYLKDVTYTESKTLYNTVSEAKNNIPTYVGRTEFSLMVQEDKWDWNKLELCEGVIKHIRVSFHKTDIREGLELCKKVIAYGYVCHCNPINIMGYNDKELLDLIENINEIRPDYFTIVDTFGSMKLDDLRRIESLLHNNLDLKIKVSVHLHENLGLAFSLAQEFISYFENKRDLFVDSSLYGIGRVPGNLCQELVMGYLNSEKQGDYDIDPVYDAIDDFIISIKEKSPWGYALPYALSATFNLHRTYPEYLMKKGKLKTKDIKAILESIIPSEKVIYNEKYIEDLYQKYIDGDADNSMSPKELERIFKGNNVVIIAPGDSISKERAKIEDYIKNNRCITVSVNFDGNYINPDFYFYTNPKRYSYDSVNIDSEKVIATSNLLKNSVKARYIVNYKEISKHKGIYNEDSVLMLIKLMIGTGIQKIVLAGFDGFSGKINHFDSSMDNHYFEKNNNVEVKHILALYSNKVCIEFITRSSYLNDEN